MSELPMDLRKLEPVGGAFDILTFLLSVPSHAAEGDDIMQELGLSSRRFDKAKRRLVTTGYIQMRSDYQYELTPKGVESAEILAAHDDSADAENGLQREAVVVLPRNLVLGETSSLRIGIAPTTEAHSANLVMRLQVTHGDLGEFNEMATLDSDALMLETTITPAAFDQARVRLEVYELSDSGDDLQQCGGMFVDVVVLPYGNTGEDIAYSAELTFAV